MRTSSAGTLLLVFLWGSGASAQTAPPPDPDAEATMRFGPLSLRSTLALTNLGIDTNVFNAADVDRPQSDFTLTFTPTTNAWLRLGRTWVDGTIRVDWVYYQRFASERSANSTYGAGVSRTFNRLSLRGNATRLNTRERPGFEIDVRSQRIEAAFNGEAELRALARTYVGVKAQRRRLEFDQDVVFLGANLAQELNRTATGSVFTVRHVLTPLTTVAMEITRDHERFHHSSARDSDSTRVAGRLSFQPLALVNGTASVGHRRFTPHRSDMPDFRGLVSDVRLSYALFGNARVTGAVARDLQYSYELDQPYYVETSLSGSVQRQVYGAFDVLARATTRRLAYRDRLGATASPVARVDHWRSVGIGAGYRLGLDKRIGFTVDRESRLSDLEGREYTGVRLGFSLTYER